MAYVPSPFTRDQLSPEMQARYGMDHSPTGRYLLAGGVIAAFVGILVMVGYFLVQSPVEGKLLSWSVAGPDRVDVRYSVTRASGVQVRCILRAQDRTRADLGYAVVDLPPRSSSDSETGVFDYSLATLAPAFTVEVLGCADGEPRVPGPQFPPGVVPPQQPAG